MKYLPDKLVTSTKITVKNFDGSGWTTWRQLPIQTRNILLYYYHMCYYILQISSVYIS